jgi:hypothetical protein
MKATGRVRPNRIKCRHSGCPGAIEASVPLWLTLRNDGSWTVYGIGDEAAAIVCDQHGHDNFTVVLHKSLAAFLDELVPGSTWDAG